MTKDQIKMIRAGAMSYFALFLATRREVYRQEAYRLAHWYKLESKKDNTMTTQIIIEGVQ